MWRRFDPGEIREDFTRIAALGLDPIRFFVRWDDFQPAPDTLDATMLERFEVVVELARDAGIQTIPTLSCGHMCGVNWLPAWALDRRRQRGRYRTIADGAESPYGVGNLFGGPLLEAQVSLARAIAGRLRDHPAIAAWDIGHAFSSVCEPSHARVSGGEHSPQPVAEPEVAEWSRRLTAALHDYSSIPVTVGTHAADLTHDRSIRFGSLCAPLDFACMQGSSLDAAFARDRLDPEVVPFLAMLSAAFSFEPVLVSGFGNPTCPPGKFSAFERFSQPEDLPQATVSAQDPLFATYPCLLEHENAAYCRGVLERLHADGRRGALWWCWADYADALRDEPPFDAFPCEMSYGIIRADGSERPVAAVLSAFAREGRSVVPADEMPMIASAYYYRTLPTSAQTLYDGFLRFVRERRAALDVADGE